MEMQLSVDFTSDIASASPPREYHLTQFNLGVVYSNRIDTEDDSPVRVWRVKVKLESYVDSGSGVVRSRAVGLEADQCLSSFYEESLPSLYCCELQGAMIAYSIRTYQHQCIVLVDWTQANGREKDGVKRWYGPTLVAAAIYFLPNDRILVVPPKINCEIRLFNWLSDWPASATVLPLEQTFDQVQPVWSHKFPGTYVWSLMQSPPLFFRDEIRLVVPTYTEVYGVTLPISSQSLSKDRNPRSLAKGSWGTTLSMQGFGYKRGVSVDRSGVIFQAVDYVWCDEELALADSQPTTQAPYLPTAGVKGRLFFDQYSSRAVIGGNRCSRWFQIEVSTTHSNLAASSL
ncbi:hypothetical protein H1R20_g12345, partial [Candolleomyces eurysporus]